MISDIVRLISGAKINITSIAHKEYLKFLS